MFVSSVFQVIYALNTKNDEHEAAIATLKEAHEEEVQQILSETREKILQVLMIYLSMISGLLLGRNILVVMLI